MPHLLRAARLEHEKLLTEAELGGYPREIDLCIDELVLHGFAQGDRWNVGDSLESEPRGLLITQGFPAAWQINPRKLDAGSICLTNSAAETSKQIAGAVYRGGDR